MSIQSKKSGFTLIELLVVVAIIAVIGAGVAVTYNKLDQRAKTAMEINDIGELTQTIKNWSFLHDWALPNELDSLIDTSDQLYSQMEGTSYGCGPCNGTYGLYAQSGFTFMAETAPQRVLDNLQSSGLNIVYRHDATRSPANDSTFEVGTMESDVDISSTVALLDTNSSTTSKNRAAAIQSANDAAVAALTQPEGYDAGDSSTWGSYTGSYTLTYNDYRSRPQTETFTLLSDWTTAYRAAQKIDAATTISTLAFVYPGGGAWISMGPMGSNQMAMNMTSEIISNIGLEPDAVARPSEDAATAAANGRKYWLVVMGLGRFATIYQGKGARIDNPVTSKRYNSDDTIYSRYLAVIRVPVEAYDGMIGKTEGAQIACILSPQALSVAALQDNYRNDVQKTQN